eukprot:gene8464-5940_t
MQQAAKRSRKEVEDPHNTWNKQLMAATLKLDIAEAEAVISKGADPVNAREATPFSKGDLLSPLAALMLSGITTPEALAMAQFLVDNGASLDDLMSLPGSAHFSPAKTEEPSPRAGTGNGRKGSAEPESRSASPGARPNSASSKGLPDEEGASEPAPEVGTMLHYVVALGDHAHLLKMLMIAGVQRPSLPQCLMHEVELGVLIPPKPVAPEDRVPSRGARKSRSNSLSRRPSRLGVRIQPEGHAPRSALPPLTAVPSPADGLRLHPPAMPDTPAEPLETRDGEDGVALLPPLAIPAEDSAGSTESTKPDLLFDFTVKGSAGLDVTEWAVEHGDITAARLLTFYGARMDFQRLVNGSQTALARACSSGDLPLVEKLLDAGDTLTQISADGRYTLVHYAVSQPAVLDYLSRRGLSLDYENAFGESALISLIRHGFGRNADHAVRETPRMADAARLAALPHAALRNYILTPLAPQLGGFGSKSKGSRTLAKGAGREPVSAAEEQRNSIGGREAGTWWSFSVLPTADMIQHLVDAGANTSGHVPPDESELRYSVFAEESSRSRIAAGGSAGPGPTGGGSGGAGAGGGAAQLHAGKKRGSLPSASVQEDVGSAYDLSALPLTDEMLPGRAPIRMTPLLCAIAGYHPELIRKMIIEYRVDVSQRDSIGASCFHYAAVCPHPSVLELLLTPGVLFSSPALDLNCVDMAGRTPLHYAVAMGQIETIKLLLAHPSILAGKPDTCGLTPLHLAVLANEQPAVELLLGHSDSMLGAANNTAMMTSGKGGRRQKAAKTTMAVSSTPNPRAAGEFQMVDVEAVDQVDNCTALEMAIKRHRDASIVQLLLSEGHAVMQRWSGLEDGGSLLHRAVVDNRADYVKILLDNFADPNEPDNEEYTPLYLAVDRDEPNVELIRSLVNAGAYSYAQSGTNLRTPLHVAAHRGHAEVLHLLFHDRVNPYASDNGRRRNGRRHSSEEPEPEPEAAVAPGAPTSVLIPSGFFLTTDSQSRTPLHILCAHVEAAAQERVLPLIEELMRCDANVYMCSMMNARGRTPLHEAARANFVEAAQALLIVDPLGVYRVDSDGNTPLHDAMYTIISPAPPAFAPPDPPPATQQDSGEGEQMPKEEAYTFSQRAMRVEQLVCMLTDVVHQTVPRQLMGMPLASSAVHKLSPTLSITAQLQQQKRYRNRFAEGPTRVTSDSLGTPWEDLTVRCVQDYFRLTDRNGRTALLVAGEQGNTVAAKTIMRLASSQPPAPAHTEADQLRIPAISFEVLPPPFGVDPLYCRLAVFFGGTRLPFDYKYANAPNSSSLWTNCLAGRFLLCGDMGGVTQSRELCAKYIPGQVFVNTNQAELRKLLCEINDTYTLSMRGRLPDGGAAEAVDDEDGPGKFTEEEIEQLFQPYTYLYFANHYLGDEAIVGDKYGGLATVGKNKYLHTLDLSCNALTHHALRSLTGLFRALPNLRHVSLGGNAFGAAGCEILAQFLREDPPLEVLSLFHCELTDSDALVLLNGLLSNTHLKLLNLDFNYCTWKFLRALIDLVKVNRTLAVVLFESMPYDPLTLKVLPQDTVTKVEYPCTPAGYFRSWRTYYHPDGLDDVGQRATAERFLLRRLVCKMDFTGLRPFPPSLLQELESYLAPRREAYVALLNQERRADLEEKMKSVVGARSSSESGVVDEADSGDGDEDGDAEAANDGKEVEERSRASSHGTPLPELNSKMGSSRRPTGRRRHESNFSGSIRRELPPLNSVERLDMVMNDAYQFRQKIHGKERQLGEKILPNGFDRVWMAPLSHAGTASVNYVVNEKPSLLQACWCDPHDAASAYAGRLHYHCKREEYIDYSQSSKKKRSTDALEYAPQKPNGSTASLDSKNLNEGGQQKQPYHGCQGTGHRCASQRPLPGAPPAGGAGKATQGGGPPRDRVTYTNKDGLVMELHYNPVQYFTSPYQPSAEIVDECRITQRGEAPVALLTGYFVSFTYKSFFFFPSFTFVSLIPLPGDCIGKQKAVSAVLHPNTNGVSMLRRSALARAGGFLHRLRRLTGASKGNTPIDGAEGGSTGSAASPERVVKDRINRLCRGSTALDHVEAVVRARRSWRQYDTTLLLPQETLRRVLEATTRAPTGFNLQGWTMVVVQDPAQRAALCRAALSQKHVLDAPATVVFAGDTAPESNAPRALEMGLETKTLPPGYGPGYLRHIYYFLHGGPLQALAAAKAALSAAYSAQTGTPLLSVPVNRTGYAWKQTMIPVTTFVQLATAAGWETCVLEGVDQDAVRRVVGLPEKFTVPVIVTVGYPHLPEGKNSAALKSPPSARFDDSHFIRFDRYQ